jgi:CRISPR-associated protein Cas5d
MNDASNKQILEVWGDFACFSRPELKIERFSYPIITPSAARGIFDAIYCKPVEFRWQITQVCCLGPPAYIALRRNEVKEKAPKPDVVLAWASGKSEPVPIWADGDRDLLGTDEKGRTQRQTMALKNVQYRLHARLCPWPGFEAGRTGMEAQFRRRASHGKCIYQPYFGCREFPAFFRLVEESEPWAPAAPFTADLGLMLYDVFDLSRPGTCHDGPSISLFRATVRDNVMIIPPYESDAVLKNVRRQR